MPRFYLRHPTKSRETLSQKGQSWDKPILKASDSDDYFLLVLHRGGRLLHPFDPAESKFVGSPTAVPDEWTGEPQDVWMPEDDWTQIEAAAAGGDLAAIAEYRAILAQVLDGNLVWLYKDGKRMARLVASGDTLARRPP